jgi:hypothetical protein
MVPAHGISVAHAGILRPKGAQVEPAPKKIVRIQGAKERSTQSEQ